MSIDHTEYAVRVNQVTKKYKLYNNKTDRLKEAVFGWGKSYHKDFYAVNDISFDIKKGETLGIIGKNGSGKSTLLKMITGVLNPSAGSIEVNGRISALLELGAGFNPEYTGIENVYLNGSIMGLSRKEIDEKLDEIIEFADIGDFIHQPVKMYSSGMFVRLAFAVAITVDPEILIVDEALAVGDISFQAKCYRKFNEFRKQGKTIIFVSHSLDSIIRYCTSCILLNQSNVVVRGTPKDVVDVYKKLLIKSNQSEALSINKVEEDIESVWKDNFIINQGLLEYGSKQAEIVDYGIFDNDGNPIQLVTSDDFCIIRMKIRFKERMTDPIFAFTIKDIKGYELLGTNTNFEKVDVGTVEEGELIHISFKQKLNLQSGDYALSLGCTIHDVNQLVVFHRLYDVLLFHVGLEKPIAGLFNVDSTIELTRESYSREV